MPNTSKDQDTTINSSDTVGSTNSVDVGTETGGTIAELVPVKLSANYSHSWESSHTFEQSVSVNHAPYLKCWISASQPMYRDTGTFTLTLETRHGTCRASPLTHRTRAETGLTKSISSP